MTEERATLELIAAKIEEILQEIAHMRADVREMHGIMDAIEGHLQRIDEILQGALGRGGGGEKRG